MTDFIIRPAAPGDVPSLLDLFAEAAEWLAESGHDQWQYDSGGLRRVESRMQTDVSDGHVWAVVRGHNDQPIATVTIDSRADAELWRSADEPESALYVHRMIVARSVAGNDIGSSLLDWASIKAATEGKRWLRLDAWARNAGLHAYYLQEGFINIRTHRFSHRGSGALFQRDAGQVKGRGPALREVVS